MFGVALPGSTNSPVLRRAGGKLVSDQGIKEFKLLYFLLKF